MAETRHRVSGDERIDTSYRYAGRGPVPGAVVEELRRVHRLGNQLVECDRAYQDAKTAAWQQDPQVAEAARAVDEAEAAVSAASDTLATARRQAGHARKTGSKASAAAAQQEAGAAKEVARTARRELRPAKDRLRMVKAERWPHVQRSIAAARQARDTAIGGTYPQARDAGMYWASWADTVSHHKAAVKRMNARRAGGRPAQLRYRRWDGTGTITVQLQRKRGVTAEERAEVAALRASGLTPAEIAERTRFSARTIALMKDHGPARAGDPPYTPAALADRQGKARNVLRLGPEPPPDFPERPRGERRRLVRQGQAAIRVGAGDAQALAEVPVTIHRPMAPGAEITMARLTVTRCGPDVAQHLTVAASIPAP
jgi:hypothetical protein